MSLQKLEDESEKREQIVYSPTVKIKKEGAFVDIFTMVITVAIFAAMIASYFIIIDTSVKLSLQEVTKEVLLLSAGTFSIGALIKKFFKSRGRETESYKKAADEANTQIKKLCVACTREQVSEYCENYMAEAIKSYRKHQLLLAGLTYDEYEKKYLGTDGAELWALVKGKEISRTQYKAIMRCNKIKVKTYDPNFITSYNADVSSNQSPSAMYDSEKKDKSDMMKSLILSVISAVFVGQLFAHIFLNFSQEAVFAAVVKVVMILINAALKASFGWNLSVMEMKRNKLRASEAEACERWCKENQTEKKEPTKE